MSEFTFNLKIIISTRNKAATRLSVLHGLYDAVTDYAECDGHDTPTIVPVWGESNGKEEEGGGPDMKRKLNKLREERDGLLSLLVEIRDLSQIATGES